MPHTRVGVNKHTFCNSSVWISPVLNPWPSEREACALTYSATRVTWLRQVWGQQSECVQYLGMFKHLDWCPYRCCQKRQKPPAATVTWPPRVDHTRCRNCVYTNNANTYVDLKDSPSVCSRGKRQPSLNIRAISFTMEQELESLIPPSNAYIR